MKIPDQLVRPVVEKALLIVGGPLAPLQLRLAELVQLETCVEMLHFPVFGSIANRRKTIDLKLILNFHLFSVENKLRFEAEHN